jgi:hypothetical protein
MKTVYVIEDSEGRSLHGRQLEPFVTHEADLIGVTYLPNNDPDDLSEDEMTLHIRLRD